MSKQIKGNHKHLTQDDRIYIEKSLDLKMPFREIAKYLMKDPTTISKEVRLHRRLKPRNPFNQENNCTRRIKCSLKNVCGTGECGQMLCKGCPMCNERCVEFEAIRCVITDKAPYVCNGCTKKSNCRMEKHYYKASHAHTEYEHLRSSSREGINLTEAEIVHIDDFVSPLIQKGQSIAHVYAGHKDDIPFTSKTLYNYVNHGVLSVRNLDLPRKVKYKPRKKHKEATKRDRKSLVGREYSDFTKLMQECPDTDVVEMDTVEGTKGGKAILTLFFRSSKFMLAFLTKDKTMNSVLEVFEYLESELGTDLFRSTFPLILTDNGSEFLDPLLLENGNGNVRRTSIFYCEPYASYQKGMLEKNHEYIRYILPKGSSFDSLSQKDISFMLSHINSTARTSINCRTPFELASLLVDERVIRAAGIQRIEHDDVCLRPSLFIK